MTLPTGYPAGYETGSWPYDPAKHDAGLDPAIPRYRVRPHEHEALADAIVRGASLTFCIIEDLRGLIEAVQRHRQVRLAKTIDGKKTIVDADGLPAKGDGGPTHLRLRGCSVERCDLQGFDIGVSLNALARFGDGSSFRLASFGDRARFDGASFGDGADFLGASFGDWAGFEGASFGDGAGFEGASFGNWARFEGASFGNAAWFGTASFGDWADFLGATFGDGADFVGGRFGDGAAFKRARFGDGARFCRASFGNWAGFFRASFGGGARFDGATFGGGAQFDDARFGGGAQFDGAIFGGDIVLHRCRFRGAVTFTKVRFRQDADFDGTMFRGPVSFEQSTIFERLRLSGARLGPRARLRFHRFLAVGDATVELSEQQVFAPSQERASRLLWRRSRWLRRLHALRRPLVAVARWLGRPTPAVIVGEDGDPEQQEEAAADYDLLAANFRKLPATDKLEDHCRWQAHELRRRATLQATWRRCRESWLDERYLYHIVMVLYPHWILFRNFMWEYGVRRTAVGYLLRPWNIAITGAAILVICSVIYTVGASPETIAYNGHVPKEPPAGAPAEVSGDPVAYGQWYWDQPEVGGLNLSGLFFSITTFVTLGYGDFAPLGWFKLITGLEALAGVTLLALFTVAWGRKLVR